MYDKLYYRPGYLIQEQESTRVPEPVQNWEQNSFKDYNVVTHPDLNVRVFDASKPSILLLGTVIDPINNYDKEDIIIERLQIFFAENYTSFLDYLDDLSGRFLLIINSADQTLAIPDAAATRPLFYDKHSDKTLLSSHPEIIAAIKGYEKSELAYEVINSDATNFPGLSTSYAEIDRLSPNTLLNVPDGEIERFFPREPLSSADSIESAVESVSDILTSQMELWNKKNDLLLSLSAGIDSRLALAATREISDDVKYYSWIFPGFDGSEAGIARKICAELGTNHTIIDLLDDAPDEFVDMYMTTTSKMSEVDRAHGVYNYYNKLPKERVELRSNVAEVGRTFYRNSIMAAPKRTDAEFFTKLYYRVNSDRVLQEFERFLQVTAFDKSNLYNYDPLDMFYWEHRMGSWLSTWVMGKDISHDTLIVYNNRTLLKKLLSVDLEKRMKDELIYRVIRNIWPKCLNIDINPHKKENKLVAQIQRLGFGIAVRTPLPIFRKTVDWHRNR